MENNAIYGKNYGNSYMMWLCRPCDARVGCHNNTKKPLGTLAGPVVRAWRVHVHTLLDPIWKSKKAGRDEIYGRMKQEFGREIHAGEADDETCRIVIAWLEKNFYQK